MLLRTILAILSLQVLSGCIIVSDSNERRFDDDYAYDYQYEETITETETTYTVDTRDEVITDDLYEDTEWISLALTDHFVVNAPNADVIFLPTNNYEVELEITGAAYDLQNTFIESSPYDITIETPYNQRAPMTIVIYTPNFQYLSVTDSQYVSLQNHYFE